MMINDRRVQPGRTREGVIHLKWKQDKNYIEMMDCLKAVNSYNIMVKMLLFVSIVFSGEPKNPADLKKLNALSLLDLNLVLNVRP